MEYQRKEAAGYEGTYDVDTEGNVFSLRRCGASDGGLLKTKEYNSGYLYVRVRGYLGVKKEPIARLVAKTFIPNPENKEIVHHIDENKQNNNIDNLMWATHRENMNYGTKNERISMANGAGVTITCPNGDIKKFNSMAKASAELFKGKTHKISYQRYRSIDKINFYCEGYAITIGK